jgi:hypothetical protein
VLQMFKPSQLGAWMACAPEVLGPGERIELGKTVHDFHTMVRVGRVVHLQGLHTAES